MVVDNITIVMSASSVTGTGHGGANKRIAYISTDDTGLDSLKMGGSPQDLIQSGSIASGGGNSGRSSGNSNDYSVNGGKAYINYLGELVLQTSVGTYSAGNYNGGGVGSKPIWGIPGWEGVLLSDFPKIIADTTIRTAASGTQVQLGLSFTVFLDLNGDGSGPFVNMVITSTLIDEASMGTPDKNGFTGAAASVFNFDIHNFIPGNFDPRTRDLSRFYIVNNLPGAVGTPVSWTLNPLTLDILMDGGAYPISGTQTIGYPNARVRSCVNAASCSTAYDGGSPAGVLLPSIIAQTGNSGNTLRSVTNISELVFVDPDGTSINILA